MRRAAIILLAVGLGAGACGLGDREAQADRIVRAGERLLAAPSVNATLDAEVTVVKSDKPLVPGTPKVAPEHVNAIGVVINALANTAAIGTNTPSGKPVIVFADDAIYQRINLKSARAGATAVVVPSNFNALAAAYSSQALQLPTVTVPGTTPTSLPFEVTVPPTTTTSTTAPSKLRRSLHIVREWATFDFAAIADHDRTKHAGSIAINPVDVLRLTKGVLAGSIERRGSAAGLTRYDANVSRDKAERRLSEATRKILNKEFGANAVGRRVFPASFWLDSAGNLARFSVTLRQQLTSVDRADLRLTFDVAPAPAAVAIKQPGRQGTVHVRTLGELVTTVTGV